MWAKKNSALALVYLKTKKSKTKKPKQQKYPASSENSYWWGVESNEGVNNKNTMIEVHLQVIQHKN